MINKGIEKMVMTEFAKKYHEKMFPGYHSSFQETDPEESRHINCWLADDRISLLSILKKYKIKIRMKRFLIPEL